MVLAKILITFLGIVTLSQCIFEIDELRRMVSSMEDNWQLRLLDREKDTPRDQIKDKVDAILKKQSKEVQDVYKKLILSSNAKEEAEYEVDMIVLKARGASTNLIDAMEQIHNITLDMSISRREEKKQIKAIKRSLGKEDRDTLNSSEEDGFNLPT